MRKIELNVSCGVHRCVIDFEVQNNISAEALESECEEEFQAWMRDVMDSGYGIKSNTIIDGY